MKRLVLLLTLLFLYGCDSKAANDVKIEIPDKSTIKRETASGVKDVLNNRGPKWVISYTGDLKGTIQGGIMTAMSLPSSTSATGMAMTKDKKGKATESFTLTMVTATKTPQSFMKMTLADGTKCSNPAPSVDVKIINKERKTFHAQGTGDLLCGDKKISYTAKLNQNP